MKHEKRSKSKHRQKATKRVLIKLPTLEKSDLAWILLKYKKEKHLAPNQTFSDFLINCGANGLLFRLWFSVDRFFRSPESYVCVWHGTTLARAVQILDRGFRSPVYTSYNPYVCLDYAESRARRESDFPALVASVIEQWYIQKHAPAFQSRTGDIVFRAFPITVTQFVLTPPKAGLSTQRSGLETWQIYDHSPGLNAPSQNELDALLDDWGFAQVE